METREEFMKKLNGSEEFQSYLDELFKGIDKNNGFIENQNFSFVFLNQQKKDLRKQFHQKKKLKR